MKKKTVSKRRMKMVELKNTFEGFYVTKEEDTLITKAAKINYQSKSGFLRQSAIKKAEETIGRVNLNGN